MQSGKLTWSSDGLDSLKKLFEGYKTDIQTVKSYLDNAVNELASAGHSSIGTSLSEDLRKKMGILDTLYGVVYQDYIDTINSMKLKLIDTDETSEEEINAAAGF